MFLKAMYLSLAIGLLFSCQLKSADKPTKEDKIVAFQSDDDKMNKAIKTSKASFDRFKKKFQQSQPTDSDFAIKVRFETPDGGGEHIWINQLSFDGKQFSGTISNEPEAVTTLKQGDLVKIDEKNITDWMYVDKDLLVGGYTIRVMRDQFSESERKEFDATLGYRIEE